MPSWHNPPNLSWLGTGTKYAGLHNSEKNHRTAPPVGIRHFGGTYFAIASIVLIIVNNNCLDVLADTTLLP